MNTYNRSIIDNKFNSKNIKSLLNSLNLINIWYENKFAIDLK